MFKKLFYRSCALFSELEDSLHHLYQWHHTVSAPGNRTLEMHALEDRILFSIAPAANPAAVQAASAGASAAPAQDAQISAMPAADQSVVAVQHVQAGQETEQSSQLSIDYDQAAVDDPAAYHASNMQDCNSATNSDESGKDRQVNFVLIDNSLQNVDQLMEALDHDSQLFLYNHQQTSPKDLLNEVYTWAQTNHAEIKS